jgi:hypothetical protein
MQQTCGSHERSRSALFQYGLDPGALRPERNGFRLGTRCIARRQAIFPWARVANCDAASGGPDDRSLLVSSRVAKLTIPCYCCRGAGTNGSPSFSSTIIILRQQAVSHRVQSTGIPWRANGSCRIYRSCLAMLARPLLVKHLR